MSALPFRRARALGLILGLVVVSLFVGTALAAGVQLAGPSRDAAPGRVAVQLEGVSAAAMPPVIPGTSVLVRDPMAAQAYGTGMDTDVQFGLYGPFNAKYAYAGHDTSIQVELGLPQTASIERLDVYGYRATSGSMVVELGYHDPTTGNGAYWKGVTLQGVGTLHATITTFDALSGAQIVTMETSPTAGFVGVVAQYSMPTNVLVPISPVRVLDTRFASMGGKVLKGSPRTISVKDGIDIKTGVVNARNAIPQGAVAVAYNLTVANTSGPGWAVLVPGASSAVTSSSINWTAANAVVANGGVVMLGMGTAERKLTIVVGGGSTAALSTHVILDITGYYISES